VNITLEHVDRSNWQAVLYLDVEPHQRRFVSGSVPPAAIPIAKAYIQPGGMSVRPYAIKYDTEVIGFFNLVFEPGSNDQYWIFHFFIDYRYQGRRLGSAELPAIVEHLQQEFPSCEAVRLTVHPENDTAQRLYRAAGFKPTGDVLFDEPKFVRSL
jgi:diamine N-acetyltransferase